MPTPISKQRAAAIIVALSRQAEINIAGAQPRLPFTPLVDAQGNLPDHLPGDNWNPLYNALLAIPNWDTLDQNAALTAARNLLLGNAPANAPAGAAAGAQTWKFHTRLPADLDAATRRRIVDATIPASSAPNQPFHANIDSFIVQLAPEATAIVAAIDVAIPLSTEQRATLVNRLLQINFKDPSALAAVKHAIETTIPPAQAPSVYTLLNIPLALAAAEQNPQVAAGGAAAPAVPPAPTQADVDGLIIRCRNTQVAYAITERLQLMAAAEGLAALDAQQITALKDALLGLHHNNLSEATAQEIRAAIANHLPQPAAGAPAWASLITNLNGAATADSRLFDSHHLNLAGDTAPTQASHFLGQSTRESRQLAELLVRNIRLFAQYNLPATVLEDSAGWRKLIDALANHPEIFEQPATAEALKKQIEDNLPRGMIPTNPWRADVLERLWTPIPNQSLIGADFMGYSPQDKATHLQNSLISEQNREKMKLADLVVRTIRAYAEMHRFQLNATETDWAALRYNLMGQITAGHTLLDCTDAELREFLHPAAPNASKLPFNAIAGANNPWRSAVNAVEHGNQMMTEWLFDNLLAGRQPKETLEANCRGAEKREAFIRFVTAHVQTLRQSPTNLTETQIQYYIDHTIPAMRARAYPIPNHQAGLTFQQNQFGADAAAQPAAVPPPLTLPHQQLWDTAGFITAAEKKELQLAKKSTATAPVHYIDAAQTTREATGVETVVTRDGSAQIHRDEQHKRSAIYAKTDKGTLHGVTAELQLLKTERERRAAAAATPAVAAQIRAESIKIKIDDRDIDLLLKENPLLLYRIVCRVIANGGALAETTKEKLEAAPPSDSFTRQFTDRYGHAPEGTTMLEIAASTGDPKKAQNVHALAVVGGPAGQPEESPRPFFPGRR